MNGGKARSIDAEDYIFCKELERTEGGIKLTVEGIGELRIEKVRAPEGKNRPCVVERASLERMLKVVWPVTKAPTWLSLNLITIPPELGLGSYMCIGEGIGCYILVSPS